MVQAELTAAPMSPVPAELGREGGQITVVCQENWCLLGWESDPEWKEQVTVLAGEEPVEGTLLTPADSLCLRSWEGFQMHPCSLG